MSLLNILKRSPPQLSWTALSPFKLGKPFSFRSTLQSSVSFTPLTQRRCKTDAGYWWDYVTMLATQNIQKDFNVDAQKILTQDQTPQKQLPSQFKPFSLATTIEVSKNSPITSNFFNTIPQDSLLHLRHLLIRDTPFSTRDIVCLLNASPYLQTIDIKCSSQQLIFKNLRSDLGSKFIADEKHYSLKRLRLANVGVTADDIVTFFEFCPRIQELELRNIQLKPNDLKKANFATLPYDTRANLKELYIFDEHILSTDVAHMLVHFPNLKRISLARCTYVLTNHIGIFRQYYPKVLFL